DDQTGQIVVIADPREYQLFDSLITKLDVSSDPNTQNEVIYLKHADAKDVSTLLSQLISGQNSVVQKSGAVAARPGQPANLAMPLQNGLVAAPTAATAAPGGDVLLNTGSTEFSNLVTIQPDERTNSVV